MQNWFDGMAQLAVIRVLKTLECKLASAAGSRGSCAALMTGVRRFGTSSCTHPTSHITPAHSPPGISHPNLITIPESTQVRQVAASSGSARVCKFSWRKSSRTKFSDRSPKSCRCLCRYLSLCLCPCLCWNVNRYQNENFIQSPL